MRRILALILVLLLLPFAAAEQSYLVIGGGIASEWTKELPAGYGDILAQIAAQDSAAAEAASIYFYPDGDGCWAFCRTKADVYQAGSFWYVHGETAYSLGSGEEIWDWGFFPGEGVFFCAVGESGQRRIRAAIAANGAPVLLDVPERIVSLHGMGRDSMLYGIAGTHDCDYVFLAVDGGALRELEAAPMDPAEFTALPGAQEFLVELAEDIPSIHTVTFLQRANGVITLNAEHDDGAVQHAYLWVQDGSLTCLRGWEDEIVLLDGAGSVGLLAE